MQPAILDRAERRVGVVVVALKDVRPFDQQLAVLGDLHLDTRERLADAAKTVMLGLHAVAAVAVSVMP